MPRQNKLSEYLSVRRDSPTRTCPRRKGVREADQLDRELVKVVQNPGIEGLKATPSESAELEGQ